MPDPALRILSYLPNPRVFKATITARLCGVDDRLGHTSGNGRDPGSGT